MFRQRLHIIIAFCLLAAALTAAVLLIVRTARQASAVGDVERRIYAERAATDSLVAALMTAESRAELATADADDTATLGAYARSIDDVDKALALCRRRCPDTTQRRRLDTLRVLVAQKCAGVVALAEALQREGAAAEPLHRRIDRLRRGTAPVSVTTSVTRPVVEQGRQVVISRRRRGFLRRLADAFRPGSDDTLRVLTTRHVATDTTLAAVNVSDTLADILSDVGADMDRARRQRGAAVGRRSAQLRIVAAGLSARINTLLADFGATQSRRLRKALTDEATVRRRHARRMGFTAVVALLLAAGFFVRAWRDMNRAARYRRALEKANARAEDLMQRREQLLLTISHDIKAPVAAIAGYADLLSSAAADRENGATGGKEVTGAGKNEALAAIRSSATHLSRLVGDLLDYHRLEAGKVQPRFAMTPLVPLLTDVCRTFRPAADDKHLRLSLASAVAPDVCLRTDAFRLRQIMENLVGNAIKYTDAGTVEVRLSADAATGHTVIAVTDTGCGLTAAECRRIFAPFTRAASAAGREGTGLGLSITRRLARLLGGDITVTSVPGQGSTFTLTITAPTAPIASREVNATSAGTDALPAATGTANAAGSGTSASCPGAATPVCPSPRRIVLVDDDRLQLQLTEAMLHNVVPTAAITSFTTPTAFFTWLDRHPAPDARPDVVLTDFEMPGHNGRDVLRQVRAAAGTDTPIPVVVLTAHTLLSTAHFLDEGFAAVLFKPFTQNDLRRLFGDGENGEKGRRGGTKGDQLSGDNGGNTPLPPAGNAEAAKTAPPCNADGTGQTAHTQKAGGSAPDGAAASEFSPLLAFACGDATAERAILLQFLADCRTHLAALRRAETVAYKGELCRIAHKLLPTLTMLNSPVVPVLQRLNGAYRSPDTAAATTWTTRDAADARTVTAALSGIIHRLTTLTGPDQNR